VVSTAVTIRCYESRDGAALARLFSETVRAIQTPRYSPEQLSAWASRGPNLDSWLSEVPARTALVAELDSEIAGFGSFEPNGHLDHLYVHHRFHGKGVGAALLHRIEEEAASRGLRRIFTESSINARKFFEESGFQFLAEQVVTINSISLINCRMEKLLA
jgi:GNAT superfamily N-acetyltransferase